MRTCDQSPSDILPRNSASGNPAAQCDPGTSTNNVYVDFPRTKGVCSEMVSVQQGRRQIALELLRTVEPRVRAGCWSIPPIHSRRNTGFFRFSHQEQKGREPEGFDAVPWTVTCLNMITGYSKSKCSLLYWIWFYFPNAQSHGNDWGSAGRIWNPIWPRSVTWVFDPIELWTRSGIKFRDQVQATLPHVNDKPVQPIEKCS